MPRPKLSYMTPWERTMSGTKRGPLVPGQALGWQWGGTEAVRRGWWGHHAKVSGPGRSGRPPPWVASPAPQTWAAGSASSPRRRSATRASSTPLTGTTPLGCSLKWGPLVLKTIPQKGLPPREEMDEYTIFRGSDLKDITVCKPPKAHHILPQDPAVLQSSLGSGWAPPSSHRCLTAPSKGCHPTANWWPAPCVASRMPASLGLGASFPSVSVGKSPMVGQAIQPGSLDNLNSKKLLPGEGSVGMQLNGRPAPPSRKATTDGAQRQLGRWTTESRRPQRRRSAKRWKSHPTNTKENTIKFEGDFDFERANVQFSREELDKEFKRKLKVNLKDDKAEKGEEKDLDVVT